MNGLKYNMKIIIWSLLLNLIGNITLWLAAIVFNLAYADTARATMDDSLIASVVIGCQRAGFVLVLVNGVVFLVELFRAIRFHKWALVAFLILLFAVLAYESFLIWTLYVFALISPLPIGDPM